MNGYSKLFHSLLIATLVILFISGLFLIPAFMIFRLEWNIESIMEWPIISGDIRSTITVLHSIFGWLMIWLTGALWSIHMRSHWRLKENRTNGMMLNLLIALLLASTLGMYYFGDELLSLYSSIVHSILGILFPLTIFLHRHQGKKSLMPKSK